MSKKKIKKDCLCRQKAIEDICMFIEHYREQKEEMHSNITIGIDGNWGSGKTFILDKVDSILSGNEHSDKYLIFHYNCWQYDYYEEPLIAIVAMMIKQIGISNIDDSRKIELKRKARAILLLFISCLSKPIEILTQISVNEIIQTINSVSSRNESKNYDDLKDFNEAFKHLIDFINELSNDQDNKKTVLFLVDELDRCMPEYAIKVLERLHHISEGVENCITVIAVNKTELISSVKNAFGYEADESEIFLRKFVNFFLHIDSGNLDKSIEINYKKMYFNKFDYGIGYDDDYKGKMISDFMNIIFKDLVIREQEHIIDISNTIHSLTINYLSGLQEKGESDNEFNYNEKFKYGLMFAELFLTTYHLFYTPYSKDDIKNKIDSFQSNNTIDSDDWNDWNEYINKLNEDDRDKYIIDEFTDILLMVLPFKN